MSDFAPGVARAAASGAKIERAPYPTGPGGIRLSLVKVAEKIREGRLDPDVMGWGRTVLHKAKLDGRDRPSVKLQLQALLDELRASTIWSPDPAGSEYVQGAAATLCLRPGLCMRGGDCDDMLVVLGSAAYIITSAATGGSPDVRIVKQYFGPGEQEHVLVSVQSETGEWLYADPSTRMPVGRAQKAVSEEWYDPLDMVSAARGVGTGPEIVTLGNPSHRRHVVKRRGEWWEYTSGSWWRHTQGRWVKAGALGLGALTTGVGTILNMPSVFELRELVKAKDYTLSQIIKAYEAFEPAWKTSDKAEQEDFLSDLNAVRMRYALARAQAVIAMSAADLLSWPLSDENVPAESEWNLVMRSVRRNWDGKTGGTLAKGDLSELNNRLAAAQKKPIDFSKMPQPTPGTDTDLKIFQAADDIKRGIDKAKPAINATLWTFTTLATIAVGVYVYSQLPKWK